MNPIKIMEAFNTFRSNHPKVVEFGKVAFSGQMEEGTIIEVSVTKPGEETITTNMKLKQSDIDMFNELKSMGMQ